MTVLKAEPWSHNGEKQWKRWDTSDPDLSPELWCLWDQGVADSAELA